jgi:serine/threonine-protein kinase
VSSETEEVPPPSSKATTPLGFGEIVAGKYKIDGLLGAGGMGLVLSARHLELDQPVAIKMMREEALRDPDSRARFAREAKAAVRLKSEHVARVFDVGTADSGVPYLVMELLEGSDLAQIVEERGPLPIDEAVAYILQACEAVAEAHAIGIVHRDLKPRNIFVTTGADGKPLVKVLDFGISKIIRTPGDTEDMALTKTKDVMGSPSYMAPEQLRAARHADERSDIWSLGVILFELVTARMPWEAESTNELCAMVFRDPPRSLGAIRAEAQALETVVMQCLEKDGSKRFASIAELGRALEPFARGLADGAAQRIESVARASRSPRTPSAAPLERPRSLGTSTAWGAAEAARVSSPVQAPSKPIVPAVAAVIALCAIGFGGWTLAHRSHEPDAVAASPPLPEDRAAIRPPPAASPAAAAPPAATVSALATPVASIPRVVAHTNAGTPAPKPPPTGVATAEPKAPDPHDMGSIGRK